MRGWGPAFPAIRDAWAWRRDAGKRQGWSRSACARKRRGGPPSGWREGKGHPHTLRDNQPRKTGCFRLNAPCSSHFVDQSLGQLEGVSFIDKRGAVHLYVYSRHHLSYSGKTRRSVIVRFIALDLFFLQPEAGHAPTWRWYPELRKFSRMRSQVTGRGFRAGSQ